MIKRFLNTFKEKSLNERFFFILGIIFLFLYFVLGCFFILVEDLPFDIPYLNRVIFGFILIIYSMIRFFRIIKKEQ
ncbi:hypothetical protein EG240_02110 [Paenimyroides tangerinum]|uniref:Uncharacterized protein n=1 Tax=Paenimyroides tangerinum TaxID=2488728 RepID=A0A3P3WCD5_9FLAO|nr:hypothetical protein [Paenimyroides tangerinum]RRJ92831.1 hypothetical protein EG240_02110 [Paenimyroides tangerinum]